MDVGTIWYLIIGALLFTVAISSSFLRGLPLSTAVVYLVAGLTLGPYGIGFISFDPIHDSKWLERVTELVVIISLFAAGLKLRLPLNDPRWRSSVRLAFVSMCLTVGLIALLCHVFLGFPAGASILLGAILAPTDPVLASGVQVQGPEDQDRLRFSLTGEAGLNDGSAFPFVMLGLGLMGLHDIGIGGVRWFLVDVLWAVVAGIAIGAFAGTVAAKFATYLRRRHQETIILDDFLALGIIAFSYGAALAVHAYGFLAVFASGLFLRRVERLKSGDRDPFSDEEVLASASLAPEKVEPDKTPALIAKFALIFDEQLERLGEVTTVLLVGAMVRFQVFTTRDIFLVPFLLLVVRPISVWLGLLKDKCTQGKRHYISWFGIRGIGSLYYLMYVLQRGVSGEWAERISAITVVAVAISILVHGISVTPLMARHQTSAGSKTP